MTDFLMTTHLSEILEGSNKVPAVIFKYSSECGSSQILQRKLLKYMDDGKNGRISIYKITVQTEPVLSKKIAEWFQIKHESPQIIIVNKGKVVYQADHNNIKIENFVFK